MAKKRKKLTLVLSIIFLIVAVGLLIAAVYGKRSSLESKNKIAVIPIKGTISSSNGDSSFFTEGGVSSTDIVSFIEAANKDKSIKGIILNIDSPGGSVVASKNIVDSIKKTDKPVVALIKEVGASGGYWIASATDYIIADPLSITGSIGVYGSYLEFSQLFSDYGVRYQKITAGEYKDLGSPYTELTEEKRKILLGKLEIIQDYYVQDVNKNRKKDLSKYANGLFYLGTEAKDIGLIDDLGGKDEAIEKMKELAKIKDYELVFYKKEKTLLDVLAKLSTNMGYSVGEGIGDKLLVKDNFDVRI